MAGALGNCYDRLVFGYVRDFVHFHVDSIGFDFAIFNFADNMLVAGAVLLMLLASGPNRPNRPNTPPSSPRRVTPRPSHSTRGERRSGPSSRVLPRGSPRRGRRGEGSLDGLASEFGAGPTGETSIG